MLYLISAGVLLVGFGVLIKMFIDGVSKVVAEPQIINDADDVNDEKSWQKFVNFDNNHDWNSFGWSSSAGGSGMGGSGFGGSSYDLDKTG